MKRARVAYAGAVHEATPHRNGLRLADGRVLAEDAVVWLPPVEPLGTIPVSYTHLTLPTKRIV